MPILGILASQMSGHLTPVYTNDYESISTVTLTSSQSSIDFTSIPSTYKALQIRGISAGDFNTNVRMRFNTSAGSYTYNGMQGGPGYGTGVYNASSTSQNAITAYDQQLGNSTYFNGTIIDIVDYVNTNKYKTARTMSGVNNTTNGFTYFFGGTWFSTAAINQITLFPLSGIFYSGTTFALYGMK